jgi:hypothetical protein
MDLFLNTYKKLLRSPLDFVYHGSKLKLRRYQQGVLHAVIDSVLNHRGLNLVVMFPRQSGKNELQAQVEVYLLTVLSEIPVEMIKISPTLSPQAENSMRRFEKVVNQNILTSRLWKKESGSGYRIGRARMSFLSGAPESNIVGATASGLLEVDEAQQVTILKYDRDISPMTASTCATCVFWGTAWTSTTLLGRELRSALAAEKRDGLRRVFKLTADEVAAEVAPYRRHLAERVASLGRNHPTIRTQYYSEEIDSQGGMFPAERIARMRGALPPEAANPAGIRALLLDVAGEDEGVRSITGSLALANPARDATALTLVEINLDPAATGSAPALPVYRPLQRWQWVGENHPRLQTLIHDIALKHNVRAVVVDATGVGAGLAAFLERALPGRVTPFTFNRASKSKLGWDFLAIVDSGRWQEPLLNDLPGSDQPALQNAFFAQLAACQYEVSDGPDKHMRWSVPDGARDPATGALLHDDWIMSAALSAVLEEMDWRTPAAPLLIPAVDPLREMDKGF